MKALVTGAAGFIGSNLALHLEAAGHEVIAVDDFFSGARENIGAFRGRFIQVDLSDLARFTAARGELSGVDAVFHQAAVTDPRHDNDEETFRKNVDGFKNLLQWAGASGVNRFVYASTAGLYGNGPTPMREDQKPEILTAYGRSKLEMERLASEWSIGAGRPRCHIVGLRYFNVFGPRESHKGRPASMVYHLAKQMAAGKTPRLFKWGEQVRDHVYVKDVVQSNLDALAAAPGSIFNVGTGVGTSFNALVGMLNRALGTRLDPEYFDMPYDPKTYQANTVADLARATKPVSDGGLGYQVRWPTERGVVDYVGWLRDSGLV